MFDTTYEEVSIVVDAFEITDAFVAAAEAEDKATRPAFKIPPQMPYSSKLASRISLSVFESLDWNQLALVTFVIIAALLCIILSGLSQMLSRSIAQDAEKRSTYECGFSPHDSATRAPFDVHYYVVGIMFLVFDVEIALIFPFASCAEELEWLAYANMAVFVIVLTVGYAYEWVRGALLWAVKLLPEVPASWNLNNSRW